MASKCQCCRSVETINHVIMYNEEVYKVWQWFSSIFQVQLAPHSSVMNRFKSWLNSSDLRTTNHLRIFIPIMIGWFSWLAKNDAKHKGKKISSISIIQKVMNCLHLTNLAKPLTREFWRGDITIAELWNMSLAPAGPCKVVSVVWRRPPRHWIKINTDGAFNHYSSQAAAGGVIRDE